MLGRLARYRWDLALVGIAAVWGLTFVTVKDATAVYPTLQFLAWRFAVAVVAFVALFPGSLRRLDRRAVVVGTVAGVWLAAGYVTQTVGLHIMTGNASSRSGFITGMFVVITPVLQVLVMKHTPKPSTVFGVVLGTAGLWLLSADGPAGWTLADTLVLACAFAYAAQLIVIGKWAKDADVAALTLMQLLVAVVGCAIGGVMLEPLRVPTGWSLWGALLLTGVLASAVAFWVQTAALRHLSPTRTAIILIMEPVFAGVFGFALRGERLGLEGWIGSALIFAGMVAAEVLGPWLAERRRGEELEVVPGVGDEVVLEAEAAE